MVKANRISVDGVAVAHYFESCKLQAYPDPGSKNGEPWTIGRGHTGPEVKPGLVWTQAQADAAFLVDIAHFERDVLSLVKVPVNQGQFDALVLFSYNVGSKALESSTLLRKLNAGDYDGAAVEFRRWNKNDGKVMRGLTRRRAAEECLFRGMNGSEAIKHGVAAA
ncbi:lysozyme [Aeromonas hydrophila]|uniref:lysozyme n=1 Tax=Aeromonas hydrophila TaxID=644 RepID=UPI001B39F68B|nr:lysozyme [Aeromonas hydrophila]MBQ4675575.1 glycoside hydrolase family protein [Aeromonas hydrophila]MBW3814666.1 glycoside hydrolase family protein [Aeromonas hydrophila]MCF7680636.1 lysozyme [Aeromonas hydrophila]MCF7693544.1 lysozyme [Aeromonas hydrophila]MCF7774415.1 lysozyme [Aeromonas hydrophila]